MAKSTFRPAIGEWGTPDPREADAYPIATRDTPMTMFAWQFLRRREDYRKRWTQLQRVGHDGLGDALSDDRPLHWRSAEETLHDEFRIYSTFANGTLDPRLNNAPGFDGVETIIEVIIQAEQINLPNVLIKFDLTLPIAPQVEAARRHLLRKAKSWPSWPSRKPRLEKLSLYLRLLDFHEERASEEEIDRALYLSLTGEQLRDTKRKNFDAAHNCQANYLKLAFHSPSTF
jgi:hypothetical protein